MSNEIEFIVSEQVWIIYKEKMYSLSQSMKNRSVEALQRVDLFSEEDTNKERRQELRNQIEHAAVRMAPIVMDDGVNRVNKFDKDDRWYYRGNQAEVVEGLSGEIHIKVNPDGGWVVAYEAGSALSINRMGFRLLQEGYSQEYCDEFASRVLDCRWKGCLDPDQLNQLVKDYPFLGRGGMDVKMGRDMWTLLTDACTEEHRRSAEDIWSRIQNLVDLGADINQPTLFHYSPFTLLYVNNPEVFVQFVEKYAKQLDWEGELRRLTYLVKIRDLDSSDQLVSLMAIVEKQCLVYETKTMDVFRKKRL